MRGMGCLEEEGGIFDNDIINNGPEEYVMTWLALFSGGDGLMVWGDTVFYDFYL